MGSISFLSHTHHKSGQKAKLNGILTNRRIHQSQLINLIAALTHEPNNRKSSIGGISDTAVGASSCLQSLSSASGGLDVEDPGVAVVLSAAKLGLNPALTGS